MVRLTVVRLLLVVILINIALTGLFAVTLTGDAGWFSRLLPGEVGFGAGYWGNYVFLSLALLVNAVLVLGAGFVVLFPAIFDDEPSSALEEIGAARWVFRIGALLFAIAVPLVLFSFARAEPESAMFSDYRGPVPNGEVRFNDIVLFTVDQAASAVSFNAPEIFQRQVGPLDINREQPWMAPAVLVFRIIAMLTFFLAVLAASRESTLAARLPARTAPEGKGAKPAGES